MTEIIKIFLVFPVFLIFLLMPLSIFNKNNNQLNLNNLSLNLIINLNILLIFSFTSIPINSYQVIFLISYASIFLIKIFKLKSIHTDDKTFFILLIFSFILFSIVIISNLNLGWDAKYFYYIKSLFFVEELNLSDLNSFEHNKWHPHLGSYIWAFFWKLPFFNIEYYGRLFYLFIFFFSLLYVVFSSLNNNYIKTIFFLIITIITFNYERFSGLQEILIFSLLLIASHKVFTLNFKTRLIDILTIFLILNLIIWIKSEGIVYVFILISMLLINKDLNLKERIFIIIGALLIFSLKSLIYLYLNYNLNAQPYNLNFILTINFEDILFRLKNIIIYSAYYSLKNIFFFLGIVVLIILNLQKNTKFKIRTFNAYFILNSFFIIFAYLFREMEIIYALKTTMERIIFTSSAVYIHLLILYINSYFKIKE
jgi:hypothetical protein|tara:strand:- start:235 stop:1509 length:1275 start_codon:yes stop_codon:yes gene_type:complete